MRARFRTSAVLLLLLVTGLFAVFQPPPGPPPFRPGKLFPPPVRRELNLTREQNRQVDALEAEVKGKLERILTEEQLRLLLTMPPPGPPGPGRRFPSETVDTTPDGAPGPRLVLGGSLRAVADPKTGQSFTVVGDAFEGILGDHRQEYVGRGIRFPSADDRDRDGDRGGAVSWTVTGLESGGSRWVRFRIHALAQDGFAVERDNLFLRVEFFKDAGRNGLDHIKKSISEAVLRDRQDLADAGRNRNLGSGTWRTYTLDVRTPFPEVDTLRLSAGYGDGVGKGDAAEFRIARVEVTPIPDPESYTSPRKPDAGPPPALASLVKLGGRWYYDPRGGDRQPPALFDRTNADRLYYLSDRLETPFVGNMTAVLRKGYYDRTGEIVTKDRPVPDNVVITFTATHLVMRSKNLPNHPTAVFPDRSRFLDGNPNVIQEQAHVWRIPLEPRENPDHVAMTRENTRALPMGPIGVATNGVVFFNPFDESMEVDAIWRLDRCCGHPSPGQEYHYHKYPVCVNTPWDDDGRGHSPLIGFAFDGFPVYGPYESAGELAKDAKSNPLNAFNLHTDPSRGPHYHVTPGKFPHILGGYWGVVDAANRPRRGPPR